MSGRYVLRRVGVASAFKIGAVLGIILSALILVPMGMLIALGVVNADDVSVAAAGTTFDVFLMFCGPLTYGLFSGIGAALNALIFNVITAIAGGLEVQLDVGGNTERSNPWQGAW